MLSVSNGHELLATVTGTGCMSSAITGCFLAAKSDEPLEAAAEALAAFGVAGEDAARDAKGPGSFHVGLYDALAALDPDDARRARADRVKLHAIVEDLETARIAVEGGATVVQWRLKDVPRVDVVERGRATRSLCARHGVPFVVNDDVEAALMLGADGVHLGRDDERRGRGEGPRADARALGGERRPRRRRPTAGCDYIGAGPVWATPSKPDADPPIGLDGLPEICAAVSTPVVAIGGIDASNAADCIRAGASGVAVIRAARDAAALRLAIDAAL